jgi:protein SCO1/2
LAEYTQFFNPAFQGATGETEQLAQLAQAVGVFYRVPENPENPDYYLVDHSSTVLVINPDGALQAIFTPPQQPDAMSNEFELIRDYYDAHN